MISVGYIFTTLAVLVGANAAGHCVSRGFCALDELTMLNKPCVYNGSAVPLKDTEARDVIKRVCPTLKPGPDFAVCCDAPEVTVLQTQLETLATLFKRCPSCYHNLANVFCHLVCSPEQSLFLEVTKSVKNSVEEMNYYITEHYATGLFDSCKNVKLASTTSRAISIACGSPNEPCSPHRWLNFLGGHDPSPYQINFHFETSNNISVHDKTFYPMNETIIPCSQAVDADGAPCSCVDCPCNSEPLLSPKEKKLFGL